MLTDVLIETARWAGVPEARRQEWRLAIRELLEEHLFRVEASSLILRVSWGDEAVTLHFETGPGELVAAVDLPRAGGLDPWIEGYLDTCRRLSSLEGSGASVLEIGRLDQAKRDAHDQAARELLAALTAVGPTHDTARRLFTLLVVLLADTTAIASLHRPHGPGVVVRLSS